MSQFFQRRPPRRAPRANVRGTVSATIQLENGRQVSGRLQQLSITGGLVELVTYLEERTWVGITIHLASGAAQATAEMMFPMRGGYGYLQPFRFTSVSEEQLHVLDREVSALLKKTTKPILGQRPASFYFDCF